jgi:hypothetical protein
MSNTADIIRAKIYNAIVEQRLPPGTKPGEKSLCEIFGVSRTLIRRLANDHVMESRPHRGDLRCLPGSLSPDFRFGGIEQRLDCLSQPAGNRPMLRQQGGGMHAGALPALLRDGLGVQLAAVLRLGHLALKHGQLGSQRGHPRQHPHAAPRRQSSAHCVRPVGLIRATKLLMQLGVQLARARSQLVDLGGHSGPGVGQCGHLGRPSMARLLDGTDLLIRTKR